MKSLNRRATVRAALGALVLLAGATIHTPAAYAAGPTIWVAQHNITHKWYGALRYTAEHTRPIAMTANEVCYLSALAFYDEIDQYGYGQNGGISYYRSKECRFGDENLHLLNTAYTLGPQANSAINLNVPTTMPGSNENDQRGVPCIKGAAFGYSWHVCSAHLQPSTNGTAGTYAQSEWLRNAMSSAQIGSGPRILGGDFNLRPRETAPHSTTPWRQSWQESDDTCFAWNKDRRTTKGGSTASYDCSNTPTALRSAKIDYIWASAFWFVDGFGVADINCNVHHDSDHCMVLGHFQWR